MFGFRRDREENKSLLPRSSASWPTMPGLIEALEDRRLLSASVVNHAVHTHATHQAVTHAKLTAKEKAAEAAAATAADSSTSSSSTGDTFNDGSTIEFSQAPTAVQTGLTALASTDGLTAPTSTQIVYLGNRDGIESYTLDYSATGTTTRITVDQNGNAVTAPTTSSTTWATLSGSGTGSNSAAAAEITAIATALGVTAPTDTTTVDVSATAAGVSTYTVKLANTATNSSTLGNQDQTTISVDSNGNPAGNQKIPFSTLPGAIQTAINGNVPTGDTALDSTSTQTVSVRTENGVTTYSVTFTGTGTQTVVTVNSGGTLTNLPSLTTVDFDTIPSAAQTELQTLATADGYTGTISTTQSVGAFDEGNGATIYTVHLSSSSTDSSGSAITLALTLSVDQNGNPTVSPSGGGMGGGCGGGDMGGGPGGFAGGQGDGGSVYFAGSDPSTGSGSTSSTTSTE